LLFLVFVSGSADRVTVWLRIDYTTQNRVTAWPSGSCPSSSSS
jgi:hypothetical protein